MRVGSEEDAINSHLPTLFTMQDQFGEGVTKAFLCKEIEKTILFLNLGKTMNPEQIMLTVEMILDGYSNLNLSDFKLFFKKFKRGDFGKFFDRLDGQLIYSALSEYKSKRMDAAEQISLRAHNEQKKQEKEIGREADVSQEYINAIKSLLTKKTPQSTIDTTQGEIVENSPVSASNNQKIQDWLREFDKIFFQQEDKSKTYLIKTIEIDGRHYNQNEYLTLKMEEAE